MNCVRELNFLLKNTRSVILNFHLFKVDRFFDPELNFLYGFVKAKCSYVRNLKRGQYDFKNIRGLPKFPIVKLFYLILYISTYMVAKYHYNNLWTRESRNFIFSIFYRNTKKWFYSNSSKLDSYYFDVGWPTSAERKLILWRVPINYLFPYIKFYRRMSKIFKVTIFKYKSNL